MEDDLMASVLSNPYMLQLYAIMGNMWTAFILVSLYACFKWKKFHFCMGQVSFLIIMVFNLITMKIKPVDGMKTDANKEVVMLVVIGVVFVAVDLLTGDPCDNRCGKMEFNKMKL